ncbi:hypothetical protein SBA4_1950021 [Candidatus Sulfopaludibacter sp. SbA4]|nr:hypothetical protein SBA4_1950021 [Candidatus Sulfopaludibacter sp. SbA4]
MHEDWENSHALDLTGKGLLSDLERHPKLGGLSRVESLTST